MKKFPLLCLALLICVSTFCFSGCTESILGHSYDNADLYTVGSASISTPVERVCVNWTGGLITFATHEGNTVDVTETTDIALSDAMKVHWWLDGTILRVEFAASGHMEVIDVSRKHIVITLPSALTLTNTEIYCASANVEGNVSTATLNVSCASGSVSLATDANAVNISAASGDIQLTHTGHAEKIMLAVASGNINASLTTADLLRIGAASGDILVNATGLVADVNIGTASGNITVKTLVNPVTADVSTSSGQVNLYLPAQEGFTAGIKTDGHFDSDLAPIRIDNKATYKDGASQMKITTKSGNIGIWENK